MASLQTIMARYVMHADANSAYLSWTAARMVHDGNPLDIRTVPAVIGGSEKSRHGIVLAKSIPAKQYGIKTGEPLRDARQKCPHLISLPPDYTLYMQASAAMVDILRHYSPRIQRFSIDECFFDYDDSATGRDPVSIAHEIRERIHLELGYTVNIGVSVNKILAKMGSELQKPNRVHTLFPDELEDKLWPLPVGDLFMVGHRTKNKLLNIGITTIGELANANTEMLYSHFKSHGYLIQAYANGIDHSPIRKSNHEIVKGIGNSTTVRFDVHYRSEASLVLMSLAETVATRLRQAGFCAGLVSVSIRSTEFTSGGRQRKIHVATDSTTYIHRIALELFDELWDGSPIRKLGLRVSDLYTNEYVQLSFLEAFDFGRQKDIDKAIDRIRGKYGSSAIYRASFIDTGLSPVTGGTQDDGKDDYPLMTSIL